MPPTAYYPEIECQAVASSLHDTQVVTVKDVTGSIQSLRVAQGFLTEEAGKTYLPVRLIDVDREQVRILVQLPYEADSGVNRIWVRPDQFRQVEAEASRTAGYVA